MLVRSHRDSRRQRNWRKRDRGSLVSSLTESQNEPLVLELIDISPRRSLMVVYAHYLARRSIQILYKRDSEESIRPSIKND